jgi:hypothetical protein
MVKVKNITKTPDFISGEAYVEDCPTAIKISVDSEGGIRADPLPEGYDWCKKHLRYAIGVLRQARKMEDPPTERTIMWY